MFENVMKTSCEIIESCWSKERAPIDTFIMGLAASIREQNDYDEQVGLLLLINTHTNTHVLMDLHLIM